MNQLIQAEMRPTVYLDCNVWMHAVEGGLLGPVRDDHFTRTADAIRNLQRGHAGRKVGVCFSHWMISVLANAMPQAGLGRFYDDLVVVIVNTTDRTGGFEDSHVVTREEYKERDAHARRTGVAEDGEDYLHLLAALRLGCTAFVSDDTNMQSAAKRMGFEVFTEKEFAYQATHWKFKPATRSALVAA